MSCRIIPWNTWCAAWRWTGSQNRSAVCESCSCTSHAMWVLCTSIVSSKEQIVPTSLGQDSPSVHFQCGFHLLHNKIPLPIWDLLGTHLFSYVFAVWPLAAAEACFYAYMSQHSRYPPLANLLGSLMDKHTTLDTLNTVLFLQQPQSNPYHSHISFLLKGVLALGKTP